MMPSDIETVRKVYPDIILPVTVECLDRLREPVVLTGKCIFTRVSFGGIVAEAFKKPRSEMVYVIVDRKRAYSVQVQQYESTETKIDLKEGDEVFVIGKLRKDSYNAINVVIHAVHLHKAQPGEVDFEALQAEYANHHYIKKVPVDIKLTGEVSSSTTINSRFPLGFLEKWTVTSTSDDFPDSLIQHLGESELNQLLATTKAQVEEMAEGPEGPEK